MRQRLGPRDEGNSARKRNSVELIADLACGANDPVGADMLGLPELRKLYPSPSSPSALAPSSGGCTAGRGGIFRARTHQCLAAADAMSASRGKAVVYGIQLPRLLIDSRRT